MEVPASTASAANGSRDLFPNLATCVDDIAFMHSMNADSPIHGSAMLMMNSGRHPSGHPCLGSWVNYGLGSENENLPGFVVMLDKTGGPISGAKNWSSGYMPASLSGDVLRSRRADPRPGLAGRDRANDAAAAARPARARRTRRTWPPRRQLRAGRAHRQLRAGLQDAAVTRPRRSTSPRNRRDAGSSTASTQPRTADFGRKCLLARRLVERGVRFIQLYSGGAHNDDNWDAHADLVEEPHQPRRQHRQADRRLLKDLKRRGLLDQTLVVWGGEFGRQPTAEYAKGTGRDHNAYGFTMWMAGGGIKGGTSVGADRRTGQRRRRGPLPRQEPARHDPEPAWPRPQPPQPTSTAAWTRSWSASKGPSRSGRSSENELNQPRIEHRLSTDETKPARFFVVNRQRIVYGRGWEVTTLKSRWGNTARVDEMHPLG